MPQPIHTSLCTWDLGTYPTSGVLVRSGMQSQVIKKAFYFLISTFPLPALNFAFQEQKLVHLETFILNRNDS